MPTALLPPIATITDDDHGGLVTIAVAVGLTYMLLCFGIRIHIRFAVDGGFGHDDITMALATVGAFVHFMILFD